MSKVHKKFGFGKHDGTVHEIKHRDYETIVEKMKRFFKNRFNKPGAAK